MLTRWHTTPLSGKELLRLIFEGDQLFFIDGDDGGGDGGPDGGGGGAHGGDGGSGGGDGSGGAHGGDDGADGGAHGGGDDDKETVTPEAARKLRSEARNLRDRLKQAEERAAELEGRDLSEKDKIAKDLKKAQDERAALEARARDLAVQVAAGKAGVRPDAVGAAAKLVDWDAIADPDDDKQVQRAVKDLKSDHPYLFATVDIDGGSRGNGKTDDKNIAPGLGRLRHAYETSSS